MIEKLEDVPIGSIVSRDKKPREQYRVAGIDSKTYGETVRVSLVLDKVDRDGNIVSKSKRYLDDTDGNREGWTVVNLPGS